MYGHLSQCILSAVFSIANNTISERKTVERYVEFYDLHPAYRPGRQLYLPTHSQQPLEDFILHIEALSPQTFAKVVLQNRQRMSTIAGILKADAFYA